MVLAVFLVIQFFLMLTTMSSASVATSMLTTNQLSLNGDPDNKVKLMWAGAIALISFSVFLTGGGINTIKSLCVVAGLPMMFIYGILVKQLMMELKGKTSSQPKSEASVEAQKLIA
uniref:Choline-glycine betaine transporter n=1 Tax=Vibrio tasmaniensis TaxID=212663 RepID=A0A0H3ZRQ8_9VIBR|nr:Choline-glycine betaine transporter [Vibrio tasmaniensis]